MTIKRRTGDARGGGLERHQLGTSWAPGQGVGVGVLGSLRGGSTWAAGSVSRLVSRGSPVAVTSAGLAAGCLALSAGSAAVLCVALGKLLNLLVPHFPLPGTIMVARHAECSESPTEAVTIFFLFRISNMLLCHLRK